MVGIQVTPNQARTRHAGRVAHHRVGAAATIATTIAASGGWLYRVSLARLWDAELDLGQLAALLKTMTTQILRIRRAPCRSGSSGQRRYSHLGPGLWSSCRTISIFAQVVYLTLPTPRQRLQCLPCYQPTGLRQDITASPLGTWAWTLEQRLLKVFASG